MQITLLPLAIDIVDVARAIILFVILAGGIARLFVDANRAQKKAPPQRPQPRVAGGEPPPNPQQDTIRAEVDEFLRRGGGQQRPQPEAPPPHQQPQRPPRIEVLDDGIELETRPRRQQSPPRVARPKPEKKKKTEERAGMSPRGERPNFSGTARTPTLTPSVRPRLSQRADERGGEIKQADERFEARMQRNFDHRAGTLAAQQATAEKLRAELSRTTLADDLMTMLSSPAGVRQALVLSEILNRPVDRWT